MWSMPMSKSAPPAALSALPSEGGDVEVWWPATTRDFVTIDDVATALIDLAGPGDRPGIVNVCSGVGLAYGDIVEAIAAAMDVRATVRSLDRPGIEAVIGDPTALNTAVGWVPAMSLESMASAVRPKEPVRP